MKMRYVLVLLAALAGAAFVTVPAGPASAQEAFDERPGRPPMEVYENDNLSLASTGQRGEYLHG